MTKTGIIALLIVIVAIFTIGVGGFIFAKVRLSSSVTTPPQKPAAAVATPLPTSALPSEEATPSAQRAGVIILNLSFQPASITVGKGSTIVWWNKDTVSHTVTAGDGSFNSGTIVAGDTFVQRFDKVKTYTYSCSIHPEMKGTIIVK